MKHDPFFNQILSRLNGKLDPDTFEGCAVELIRLDGYAAVPVLGGDDAGMDGAIADGQGEPFPLVTTTSNNCIGNLTRNLKQYIDKGGERRKVIFATPQALSPQKQRNLYERAGELGFTLIQLYERSAIAARLYRNPAWCKELLQLTGTPSALSVIPLTRRPFLNNELIGRQEALDWLQQTTGDRLLAGEPGSGKTSLLYRLTQIQAALFVVSKDVSSIADAIREQKPQYIIVDDAHVDPDFLISLKRLRTEIGAKFDIIATCWTGDVHTIADILNLADSHIYTLRRLTRDQIVEVIAAAGIRGVNWLVREIVTQSEGLPGLAVTLVHLCLQGSVQRIQSAAALSSTILDFYVKRVESHVQEILAAFALGGEAGMPKLVIGRELDTPLPKLRKVLAELATGGVIAEVDFTGDRLKVRPSAFRHALIREIFFSGASALPISTLNNLLQQTPNMIETAQDLIHVKARGGNVPDYLLQEYLSALPTVSKVWIAYAWLGPVEAMWVLEHFQGATADIAYPTLANAPQRAISALISEAVGDDRLLNATPEHPLRRLQDWMHEAYPGSDQAVGRRRLLFERAKRWLLDMNDAATGYKALLYAMDPKFESHTSDPGSGNTITLRSAYLTAPELTELQTFWHHTLELTKEIPVPDWQPFIDVIHEWAYPHRNPSEEAGVVMRTFAKTIAQDIAEAARNKPSVVYNLKKQFESLVDDLSLPLGREISILYPPRDRDEDWREQEARWLSDVKDLANEWQGRKPQDVVDFLAAIENEMAQAQHVYPRLTLNLCHFLAQATEAHREYISAIITSSLPSDMLFPFLSKITQHEGWEEIIQNCIDDARFKAIAVQIVLTMPTAPESLLSQALTAVSDFPGLIEHLYWRNQIPEYLLVRLMNHPDKIVASTAALAEWQREPKGHIRDWLRTEWEAAILQCTDDYWLGEIFETERHLAFAWLESRIKTDEFEVYRFDNAIAEAIAGLEQSERRRMLEIIPDSYGYHDVVAQLVADDLELFSYLLASKRLEDFHLAPIAGDIDKAWCGKAKLAYNAGYSAQEIAVRTMMPIGVVVTWGGKESERYKGWLEKFSELHDSDDESIRTVGLAGSDICREQYQRALHREYLEDVYGID